MEKIFYELQQLLADQGLPEFPSFLPPEKYTQEIVSKYKELYPHVLQRVLLLKDTDKFNDYLPFLFDFITIPLYCKEIDDFEKVLENEEPVDELDFDIEKSETTLLHQKTDFVTASGQEVIPSKKKINQESDQKVDSESGIDEKILEKIRLEILDKAPTVNWNDIAGLDSVKASINEIVVWPMLRPDIFKGLRNPPKGMLLFGPPGTGKTMIGKCVASQCKATFFSISASSLTSKWVGEGEKMVRALFYMARKMQPSVVFIDEIDSLLSQRTDNENDGMRRIKTEFLVQFDGASTNQDDRILVIGATNRPHEIDEAARRRLVKRIYVPLPCKEARLTITKHLLKDFSVNLITEDYDEIANLTDGYSGSDMFNLCREASMEPIREIVDIFSADPNATRPININDFRNAIKQIRKSVCEDDLKNYDIWNQKFGSI
ncbi:hypothetical protein EDEG_02778 [Edhazardia aedis USNM 41457]|uniref:AAA+ ATPase domain-containing protein n=1 Tax=Edhazardia aedis (strain USNM 41457) TaxID=1003232 RepID=J9DN80_EDHAE|nr:hypothetical protein EDEG_02778 [Edhazardia aedis USNM 41457]|eukprot:EJW02837.1 hypothetical protein EDEG_02778 [Edhazardia aedis USNM 41457]